MKIFSCLLALCVCTQLMAQEDSTSYPLTEQGGSYITLTRNDMERLPATSFMELVQGAFPFIGANATIGEDYTYVVNGFVLVNPDAINLSQIESISFYPAGTTLTRGSLANRGTFVISTRPSQGHSLSVSTKTGILQRPTDGISDRQVKGGDNGFLSIDELNFRGAGNRSWFSSSLGYIRNNIPSVEYTLPYIESMQQGRVERWRTSHFGGININNKWSVNAAFNYTLQKPHSGLVSHWTAGDDFALMEQHKVNALGGHAGVRYNASKSISNELRAEYSRTKDADDSYMESHSRQNGSFFRTGRREDKYNLYNFSNRLQWQPMAKRSFKLNASLLLRYRLNKQDEAAVTQSVYPDGSVGIDQHTFKADTKSFLVSPALSTSWKDIVYAQLGVSYDDYKISQYPALARQKLLPDAALRLQLASLLHSPVISSLEIATHYLAYIATFEDNDRLETEEHGFVNQPPYQLYPQGVYDASSNWITSAGFRLWQDRLGFRASYQVLDTRMRVLTPWQNQMGIILYALQFEPLYKEALAFELTTRLVQSEHRQWNVQASVTKEKYTHKNYPSNFQFYQYDLPPLFFDESPWYGGLKTNLTLNRFFLQASALLAFKDPVNSYYYGNVDKISNHRANFLLAGYQFPLKNGAKLELNVQSKNLFASNDYYNNRYVGGGVSVKM